MSAILGIMDTREDLNRKIQGIKEARKRPRCLAKTKKAKEKEAYQDAYWDGRENGLSEAVILVENFVKMHGRLE